MHPICSTQQARFKCKHRGGEIMPEDRIGGAGGVAIQPEMKRGLQANDQRIFSIHQNGCTLAIPDRSIYRCHRSPPCDIAQSFQHGAGMRPNMPRDVDGRLPWRRTRHDAMHPDTLLEVDAVVVLPDCQHMNFVTKVRYRARQLVYVAADAAVAFGWIFLADENEHLRPTWRIWFGEFKERGSVLFLQFRLHQPPLAAQSAFQSHGPCTVNIAAESLEIRP
jgi:hypothetical protein